MKTHKQLLSAALAVAMFTGAGCTQRNEYQPPPPPTVSVSRPVVQTVMIFLEETGSTEAVQYVDIRARVKGFLEKVEFEPNDDVKEGQLLYLIDPKPYEAVLAQQQAALHSAEAEAAKADADFRRGQQLVPSGTITQQEFDQLAAIRLVKQANIEAAKAAVQESQLNVDYTKVESPIDGRVDRTLVYAGNLVGAAEATHLTTVVQYDPIFATFNISERSLLDLLERPGRAKDGKVNKEDVQMFLRRGNDTEFRFTGRLDYYASAVDESTGTYLIRGVFPNPTKDLVPGLFVRIRLPIGEKKDALLVPQIAVGADQAGRYLLVVNSENKVQRRDVTLGTRVESFIVVEDGLDPSEKVIVDGVQRARPDIEVTPKETTLTPPKQVEMVTAGSGPLPEDLPPGPPDEEEALSGDAEDQPTGVEESLPPDDATPGPPADSNIVPPTDATPAPAGPFRPLDAAPPGGPTAPAPASPAVTEPAGASRAIPGASERTPPAAERSALPARPAPAPPVDPGSRPSAGLGAAPAAPPTVP